MSDINMLLATFDELPAIRARRLAVQERAEFVLFKRQLELERWTHSHQDPDHALVQLQMREGVR